MITLYEYENELLEDKIDSSEKDLFEKNETDKKNVWT